ncbi:MAG: IS607 family transposase [Candidatus Dormibacteria bacterium]
MRLSEWAKQDGVSRQGATRWFHAGVLPVPARRLATGTILVDEPARRAPGVAIYARVSSADQRGDLDRQVARLTTEATGPTLPPTKVVAEVGSGLDGHRTKLLALPRDPAAGAIVVEHRDLCPCGAVCVEHLEAALAAQGRRVVVVEEAELADDLVRDMVEVLTSFCARRYGRRSAKRGAQAAVSATQAEAAA